MAELSLTALWVNPVVNSKIWISSFIFVKLITKPMHPFAFAASREIIAMSALLVCPVLRSQALPACNGLSRSPPRSAENARAAEDVHYNASPHDAVGTLAAVARTPRAGERS